MAAGCIWTCRRGALGARLSSGGGIETGRLVGLQTYGRQHCLLLATNGPIERPPSFKCDPDSGLSELAPHFSRFLFPHL